MIERMTKYSFVLLSGEAESFLRRIEELGLVDITRSTKPVDETSSRLFAQSEECRKAINALNAYAPEDDPDHTKFRPASDIGIEDPLELYQKVSARSKKLTEEIEAARKEVEEARAWGVFDPQAIEDLASRGLKIRFYKVPKKSFDPSWSQEYALQETADDGRNVWFVTASDDPGYSFPAEEIKAPENDFREAEGLLSDMEGELIACKGLLSTLKDYVPLLRERQVKAETTLQRYLANAGAGKAAENLITTFEGFAPAEDEKRLSDVFDSMDGVIYLKEDALKEDNPPIKLKGNWFTRMFTVLTDMYGRPEYNEFDPTPYISFFFTLFFAMCMGDAGYGLVLLVLGLLMRKSEGSMGKFAPLITTLGAATFVMGIIFHMFFGIDISTVSWVPSWLKKCMITGTVAGYDGQMLFSILIGIIHLSVAMVLKAVYAVKRNGFKESLGTLGWTTLIVGGVIVGGFALLGVIDKNLTKWIVIVLGSISAVGIFLLNDIHRNPLKNIGSGLYETYNTVTGLLGDVLSYLRLYALGLAGGMLGSAFNSLGLTVLDLKVPGLNIFFCILILVFGHVLNLAMCCLGAFVHPLRLNFLEFFKNSGYEGAGRTYSPLGAGETE